MKVRFPALCLIILTITLPAVLFCGCGNNVEEQENDYGPPQVQLPVDEGAHPEAAVEWWYTPSPG